MNLDKEDKYLPVLLKVTDKNILMIGAGKACREKLRSLSQIQKDITVIAPEIHEDFLNKPWIKIIQKQYEKKDLYGFDIVYIGINDPEKEKEILKDAHELGILVNFVDQREFSHFISPSVIQKKNFSIFISTFGKGPGAAKNIRKTIEEKIDLDKLDEITGEYIIHRKNKRL